ncbi:MAG: helix-turn-helix domain-containing protein [Patescibacteria group bacterium]
MVNIQQILEQVGLTESEAACYRALLPLGAAPVGEVIKLTKLHREIVYRALADLEDKGMVRSFEKNKKLHYQAEAPSVLLHNIKFKADLLKEYLPKLEQYWKTPPQMIRVLTGAQGYEWVQQDIQRAVPAHGEYYVIGASGSRWYEITADFYKRYRRKNRRRGVTLKMVTYAGEAKDFWTYEQKSRFVQIRALPEHFAVPSSTKIYGDRIAIQMLSDEPAVIVIQNQEVAKAYKQYFNVLWKMAKAAR